MNFPDDLMSISSDAIQLSDQVAKLSGRLDKKAVITPRELKVYEHLVNAYEELRAAIRGCQEAQP